MSDYIDSNSADPTTDPAGPETPGPIAGAYVDKRGSRAAPRLRHHKLYLEFRRPVATNTATVAELTQAVQDWMQKDESRSLHDFRSSSKLFLDPFGDVPAIELHDRLEDIEAWVDSLTSRRGLGLSNSQANKAIGFFAKIYTFHRLDNPIVRLRNKPTRKPRHPERAAQEVLSMSNLTRLMFDPRIPIVVRNLLGVLFTSGARDAEGFALSWKHVMGDVLVIQDQLHQKTHQIISSLKVKDQVRSVPIIPALRDALARCRAYFVQTVGREPRPSEPICLWKAHRFHMSETTVYRWNEQTALRRAHKAYDLLQLPRLPAGPWRLHATRHNFITHLLRAGANPLLVRRLTHSAKNSGGDAFGKYVHMSTATTADLLVAASHFKLDEAVIKECEAIKMR